jgi:hypothetical protein
LLPVILDTGSVWVPDRGIWETFEKAVSKKARISHVGQKSVSFPDFCLGMWRRRRNREKEIDHFSVAGVTGYRKQM